MKRKFIEGVDTQNETTTNEAVAPNTGDDGLDRLVQNGTIQHIQICCGVPGPHQRHRSLSITLQNGTNVTSISGIDEKSMSIQVNGEIYKKKEILSFTNPNFSFLSAMNNNRGQLPKTYQLIKISANDHTQTPITSDEFDAVFNQLPDEIKNVLVERINSNFRSAAIIIIGNPMANNNFNNNHNDYDRAGCRIS